MTLLLNVDSTRHTQAQTANLQAALNSAEAGLPVFPVAVTRKANGKKKAKPLVEWGSAATTDLKTVKNWWRRWPDAVPGAATGDVFVVDLDVDPAKGPPGEDAFRALGLDPDDADFIVRTPSGGRHLYFDKADGLTISAGGSGVAPNIDTRGEGRFRVRPGRGQPIRHL